MCSNTFMYTHLCDKSDYSWQKRKENALLISTYSFRYITWAIKFRYGKKQPYKKYILSYNCNLCKIDFKLIFGHEISFYAILYAKRINHQ